MDKERKPQTDKQTRNNLANQNLTDEEVSLLSRGLKFIATHVVKEENIRRQLLQDFKHFARCMPLQYIFHEQNNEPHPFHVKSDWQPPV